MIISEERHGMLGRRQRTFFLGISVSGQFFVKLWGVCVIEEVRNMPGVPETADC